MTKGKKILIIEDEKYLVELYERKFKQYGYEVLVAYNGIPGTELAIQKKPDLILLDIVMPKKDGYQVLRDLKKEPQTENIPIIVFSNLGQKEEIDKGLALGADDYLVKSGLTPKQVVEKVGEFFKRKK